MLNDNDHIAIAEAIGRNKPKITLNELEVIDEVWAYYQRETWEDSMYASGSDQTGG